MIEILNNLNYFDTEKRKSVLFSLWSRPTIPFKLECEYPNAKQDMISKIYESAGGMNPNENILREGYINAIFVLGYLIIAQLSMVFILGCARVCGGVIVLDVCDTILVSAHAFVGAFYIHKITQPLLSFPD